MTRREIISAYFAGKRRERDYLERKQGAISPSVIEAITNSIKNRWLLSLAYYGPDGDIGRRWVEPYVLGLSRFTGNTLLRVYQYQGITTTIIPGWKTFRCDRIRGTAPLTSRVFNKPKPLYNPEGDELMSSIILQVSFPDA